MLQVRNLPDDVHAKLKERARQARMSLSEYVGRELAILVETKSAQEILDWAATQKTTVTVDQIVDAVRSGREERE